MLMTLTVPPVEVERLPFGRLNPGDLFSFASPLYWKYRSWPANSVAELLRFRTEAPAAEEDREKLVTRVTIMTEHARLVEAVNELLNATQSYDRSQVVARLDWMLSQTGERRGPDGKVRS